MTEAKRAYRWHIPLERRKELNKERWTNMKRGRDEARQRREGSQPAGPVNTPAEPTENSK